jgi:hypothetical protein
LAWCRIGKKKNPFDQLGYWDVMCMLRSLGGMDIIDLKNFNIALMEK